ncbi:MAG: tetratricopeptide repeat protein [Alphaproteobacteria bacterium]|nr:tetratricopeptide repeat protein [Alphaproteobacteria bacterium]
MANRLGVEPDEELAVKWYSKAVEQGDDDAQARLGLMYESGTGVEKNLEKAKRWYGLSAEQGNAEALSLLDRMVSVTISAGV